MNKQELIGKYEDKLKDVQLKFGANFKTKVYDGLIKDLKQLDEPQKPVVPQFVANWYEEHKDDFEIALFRCIDHIPSVYDEGDLNEFEEWIIDGETKPFQTLVNMHQFGYTVEKEPKYTVKIKSVNQYLVRNTDEDFLGFLQSRLKSKFTRKELEEAGLSDVFNSSLFEVEEVEE